MYVENNRTRAHARMVARKVRKAARKLMRRDPLVALFNNLVIPVCKVAHETAKKDARNARRRELARQKKAAALGVAA